MKSTYSLLTLYLEKSQEILSFNNDNQSSETLCQSTYERDTEESKLDLDDHKVWLAENKFSLNNLWKISIKLETTSLILNPNLKLKEII